MFRLVKNIIKKNNRVHIQEHCYDNIVSNFIEDSSICRICYNPGICLISPCNCDGSIKYIHKHCLLKWIKISKSKKCEICCSKYKVNIITRRRRLTFWKSIKKKFKRRNTSYQISIYDI